ESLEALCLCVAQLAPSGSALPVLSPRPFRALVLSAGFGTRLAPLTREIPKPLVPLGNRPLLHRTLEKLHELGAERLVVNVHHCADKIINSCNGLLFKVHVVHELNIRGTAGGISGARNLLLGCPAI